MKFSIIVVSLNAGKALADTVNSILMQTYQDYEILIKDGESTDGSLAALPEDQRIRVISKKDGSIYDGMNQAVKHAAGEYFIFMNCGDFFYDKTVLSKTAKEIIASKADILYGNMVRQGTEGIIPFPKKITDFTCYRNVPCHQVCFYSRACFEERGYDLSFPVRADYEHFLYCKYDRHMSFKYMDLVVALYEGDGFSESKGNEKKAAAEHKIITKKYLKGKCILYKFIMIITLQPVRKWIAGSRFSGIYQGVKSIIYGRKKA